MYIHQNITRDKGRCGMISHKPASWCSGIPETKTGSVTIERFEVGSPEALFEGMRGRRVIPGTYTRLMIGRTLWMSDTQDEFAACQPLFQNASGHVLVNGLGLGCVVAYLHRNCRVTDITVIEINKDVIDAVAPHFPDVRVIHGDARTIKHNRGQRWDTVWHDIWPDISVDNIPEMTILHRKYGQRCRWQDSWQRQKVLRIRRRNRHDKR